MQDIQNFVVRTCRLHVQPLRVIDRHASFRCIERRSWTSPVVRQDAECLIFSNLGKSCLSSKTYQWCMLVLHEQLLPTTLAAIYPFSPDAGYRQC